jgi:peptidoglycan/LPS O-acetylase OafA/YrhL
MDHRKDIDGLRALGVALVVFFHLQLPGSKGGFIGVDVFFVVSGYLMTRALCADLDASAFQYLRFIGARVLRIWPALAVMIVVLLALGGLYLPPFDLEAIAEQGLWAALAASNHLFLSRSGYNTHADDAWLLHTWSLAIECQFYALYPLVLWAIDRVGARRHTGGVGSRSVLAVALIAVSASSMAFQAASGPEHAFFLLAARVWELLAGGLVFVARERVRGSDERLRQSASYAGVALILLSALAFAYLRQTPDGAGLRVALPVAGAALVLWANARNVLLEHPLAQRVGAMSYSVYLWHWPVIIAFRLADAFVQHGWLAAGAAVALSLGLGFLSFRYVEQPMRVSRTKLTLRAFAAPVSATVLACALCTSVMASDGLSWRERGAGTFVNDYFARERPFYFLERCDNFIKPANELKVCSISKSSKRRLLVIGDSHAEHYYSWFAHHSAASVDFFTVPECPPVPRFERLQTGFHCMDYAAAAWRKALTAEYDAVIVSARWATVDGPLPYCHAHGDVPCTVVTGGERRTRALAELRQAIEEVLAAGKEVVFVTPTPESRFVVPERLAREIFWYGSMRLQIDRAEYRAQTAWLAPLLASFQGRDGFHSLALTDKLCDRSACRVFDATFNRPIYLDQSHFDPEWIIRNGDMFAPFVRAQ